VVHHGPFEHTSTLKLIEKTFGLSPLTARDSRALDLGVVLQDKPRRHPVPASAIPTSADVVGPANDAAAICSAASTQSVSPQPVRRHAGPHQGGVVSRPGGGSGAGMADFGKELRKRQ